MLMNLQFESATNITTNIYIKVIINNFIHVQIQLVFKINCTCIISCIINGKRGGSEFLEYVLQTFCQVWGRGLGFMRECFGFSVVSQSEKKAFHVGEARNIYGYHLLNVALWCSVRKWCVGRDLYAILSVAYLTYHFSCFAVLFNF